MKWEFGVGISYLCFGGSECVRSYSRCRDNDHLMSRDTGQGGEDGSAFLARFRRRSRDTNFDNFSSNSPTLNLF